MDQDSKTRVEAIEQLNEARSEQQRCAEQHDAALGSSGELAAQSGLKAAEERFAAREAWAKWTERDY